MADEPVTSAATRPAYPDYEDEWLSKGREVWLATCEGCHGYGTAGSPRIGDLAAWQTRIAQGKAVLYQHALEGFFGVRSTHMPARGGNERLSDEEVIAAVDYMVEASSIQALPQVEYLRRGE